MAVVLVEVETDKPDRAFEVTPASTAEVDPDWTVEVTINCVLEADGGLKGDEVD